METEPQVILPLSLQCEHTHLQWDEPGDGVEAMLLPLMLLRPRMCSSCGERWYALILAPRVHFDPVRLRSWIRNLTVLGALLVVFACLVLGFLYLSARSGAGNN